MSVSSLTLRRTAAKGELYKSKSGVNSFTEGVPDGPIYYFNIKVE